MATLFFPHELKYNDHNKNKRIQVVSVQDIVVCCSEDDRIGSEEGNTFLPGATANKPRKRKSEQKGTAFRLGAVVVFAVAAISCFGLITSFANAGAPNDNTFGLNEKVSAGELSNATYDSVLATRAVYGQAALSQASTRDIDLGDSSAEGDVDSSGALGTSEESIGSGEDSPSTEASAGGASGAEEGSAAEGETDTASGEWQTGWASAYNIASSSTMTASGAPLTDDSVTVAVPLEQSYLMGKSVEIQYEGMTVVALVTDVGSFGAYGRSLDFAPGVCKAFGVDTGGALEKCYDWGVRQVQFRFL